MKPGNVFFKSLMVIVCTVSAGLANFDGNARAEALTIKLDSGVTVEGTVVQLPEGTKEFQGVISIMKKNMTTSAVCDEVSGKFCIRGRIAASMTGKIPVEQLNHGPDLNAADVEGAVDWREGQIYPLNIAEEILRQVAQIPGFELIHETLRGKEFIIARGRGTHFQLLRAIFTARDGGLLFSDAVLKNPDYLIQGSGGYSYRDGHVAFRGLLIILSGGSSKLIQRVPALQRMENNAGRLAFPFRLEGPLEKVTLKAELGLLTDALMESYRDDLIQQSKNRRTNPL